MISLGAIMAMMPCTNASTKVKDDESARPPRCSPQSLVRYWPIKDCWTTVVVERPDSTSETFRHPVYKRIGSFPSEGYQYVDPSTRELIDLIDQLMTNKKWPEIIREIKDEKQLRALKAYNFERDYPILNVGHVKIRLA